MYDLISKIYCYFYIPLKKNLNFSLMDTSFIHIDHASTTPKYKQIIESIHEAIENKILKAGHKIPSINAITQKHGLSRDTVLTALGDLQSRGIIVSAPGKGYYIKKSDVNQKRKIFLLFDKLTSYKEVLYESFIANIQKRDKVDMFFHNFNNALFESLIKENIGQYTDYVIMPIPSKTIAPVLELIPKDKLYILDRGRRLYGKKYPSVCQHFKEDILSALRSGKDLLEKYRAFLMLVPDHSHVPNELIRGFRQFCKENSITHNVSRQLENGHVEKNNAYLVLDDRNLVKIVKDAYQQGFIIGKDIGIISYNDAPLKSIVANGITTISTDFEQMGQSMASLILNKKKYHIDNPSMLIRRNSL